MRDCPLCQINAKPDATVEEIDRAIAEFKEGHWRGGGEPEMPRRTHGKGVRAKPQRQSVKVKPAKKAKAGR